MIAGRHPSSTPSNADRVCWADRRRRDRTVRSSAVPCGNPSQTGSGLCLTCWRILADPGWWDRLTRKTAA